MTVNSLYQMYPHLEQFTNDYIQKLHIWRAQSVKFLAALAQIEESEIDSERFCFQIIKQPDAADLPADVTWTLASHRTGSFNFCQPWLTEVNLPVNGGLCGAYVCVNETDGKGRKASNVVGVRALFVELDHGGLDASHIASLRDTFKPSIIVESSPGKLHVYWILCPASCPLEKFSACQQLIQKRFENLRAGKEAKDLPRVLRVPGFLHLKDLSAPFVVKLHHCESSWIYDPDSIFALLGIDA